MVCHEEFASVKSNDGGCCEKKKVDKYRRRQIPDYQVKDVADQYEAARKLLEREGRPPKGGLLLPLINTAAVAIELYIKCLCSEVVHTPVHKSSEVCRVSALPEYGHDLIKLFEKVPKDVQKQLSQAFEVQKPKSSAVGGLLDFLKEFKGVFEQSRYPFEKGKNISNYHLSRLMWLSEFLAQFVASLSPREFIEKVTRHRKSRPGRLSFQTTRVSPSRNALRKEYKT